MGVVAKHESPEVEDEADLKARVVRADWFRVGLADSQRGFIHVTVRILSGRTDQAKQDFSLRKISPNRLPSLEQS